MTNAERLIALETEFRLHRESVERRDKERDEKLEQMNKNIQELLSLRAKGQGAFWLATTLFGTSFAVAISYFISWFK
jgi:hypothetical protein